MIAKLIVKGRDRPSHWRMKRALEMFVIEGIKTSIRCTGEFWPIRISQPVKLTRTYRTPAGNNGNSAYEPCAAATLVILDAALLATLTGCRQTID